jgi:hypothetical protein
MMILELKREKEKKRDKTKQNKIKKRSEKLGESNCKC